MMRLAAIALLAASGSASRTQEEWPELRPLEVTLDERDGVAYATVRATNASIERIVEKLAAADNRTVEGFSMEQPGTALVTVELVDRPLRQVLEYTLGSVGLDYEFQPSILRVVPRTSGELEILESRALAHYLRASRSWPDHPESARARLVQGNVELRRRNLTSAVDHYRSVAEDHPESDFVPDAQLASAQALEELGRFESAHEEYLMLTALPPDDERRAAARMGMVRCQLELGNPSFAILMLRRMDQDEPTSDRAQLSERYLLKARALERSGLHVETLQVLDQLERIGADIETRLYAMGVRARALQALEYLEPAARAWLVVARETTGPESDEAYERAAELSLASGAALSVLLLETEVKSAGSFADISASVRAARLDLGLTADADPLSVPASERLEIAYADASEGRVERARAGFEQLFAERNEIEPELLVRVAVELAELRYVQSGSEPAIRTLAEARDLVPEALAVESLHPAAASIFERDRDYARAADAYAGLY